MGSFSDRLSEIMSEKKITPYNLSKNTKLSESTVGRILKGKNTPNDKTILAIANFLDVSFDWLKSGTGQRDDFSSNAYFSADLPSRANRLAKYLKHKGLKEEDVSAVTKFSLGDIKAYLSGTKIFDLNSSLHFMRTFPDLNWDWVEVGEGRMLLSKAKATAARADMEHFEGKELAVVHSEYLTQFRKLASKSNRYILIAPLIEEFEYDDYIQGWGKTYYPHISEFAICVENINLGNYLSFFVRDDSMENNTKDSVEKGDIITGRMVDKEQWTSRAIINKHKLFVIHHANKIDFRIINEYVSDSNCYHCSAMSMKKGKYPDSVIKLDDVKELYSVYFITKERR